MQSLLDFYKIWAIYGIIQKYIKLCKITSDNLFLFSLQGTENILEHSRKFMVVFFCKKSSTLDFWFLNAALGNILKKKNSHLKDISPALLKTFCVIILIMHI